MKKCQLVSLETAVNNIAHKRVTKNVLTRALNDEGWRVLKKGESLCLRPRPDLKEPGASVTVGRNASQAKVLFQLLPPSFVKLLIERRFQEKPTGFDVHKGHGRTSSIEPSVQEVYQVLATRAWIQGGNTATDKNDLRTTFVSALRKLSELSGQSLPGVNRAKIILTHLVIRGSEARELSTYFASLIDDFGEILAGDEKLFKFTGRSGLVRQVKNKPARLGLWHYQAVVLLRSGLPFLAWTRLHESNTETNSKTFCAAVVEEWVVGMKAVSPSCILVMDSYYLDGRGRGVIKEHEANVIAAVQHNRLPNLWKLLSPHLSKTGVSAFAFNEKTEEAVVAHWSREDGVGKKLVLSTAFSKKAGGAKKGQIPIYDHYKVGFRGCDVFNQQMHGRTWPFRSTGYSKAGTGGESGNIWDYLFTTLLLNAFNLWKDVDIENRGDVSFKDFTHELALDVLAKLPGMDLPIPTFHKSMDDSATDTDESASDSDAPEPQPNAPVPPPAPVPDTRASSPLQGSQPTQRRVRKRPAWQLSGQFER